MKLRSILLHLAAATFATASCGDPVIDIFYTEVFTILDIEPLEGPSTGGTRVTIHGRALCPGLRISFGETAPLETTVLAPGEVVTVMTPPHAIGDVHLTAFCPTIRPPRIETPFTYSATNVALQTKLEAPIVHHRLRFLDFNRDGLDDLIAPLPAQGRVAAYANTRKNGFTKEPLFDIPLEEGIDYDALFYDFDDTTGTLTVIYKSGAAIVLASKSRLDAFQSLEQRRIDVAAILLITVADINADRRSDVFVLDAGGFAVYLSNPYNEVERLELVMRNGIYQPSILHGDFDQNGVEDVALATFTDVIVHVMGTANGTPEVHTTRHGEGVLVFANDDSWPDLISSNPDPLRPTRLLLAYGLGGGELSTFEERHISCGCEIYTILPETYDLNENGQPDQLAYTDKGLMWIEISTRSAEPLGVEPFLGAAKMNANQPPAIIYGADTMRAAYLISRDIVARDTPPLIPTESWSCFGVFDGTRVTIAPSKTSTTSIVHGRDTIEVSGGVDLYQGHKNCTTTRFGDDRSDYLIFGPTYGDQPPYVIRQKNDGTYTATRVLVDRDSPFPVSGEPLDQPWMVGDQIARVTARGVELFRLEGDAFVTTARGLLRSNGFRADAGNSSPPFAALINDDDLVDVIYPNANVTLFFGKPSPSGELSFDEAVLDPMLDPFPTVRVLDFDGDADWDIAVETRLVPRRILLYENDGDGNFTRHLALDRIFDATLLGSCDLDGDHRNDLIFGFDDAIGYVLRDRDGGLGGPLNVEEIFTARPKPFPAWSGCFDYDEDGLNDFMFRESGRGTIHVFYNGSK
jgi:hypothetical protein